MNRLNLGDWVTYDEVKGSVAFISNADRLIDGACVIEFVKHRNPKLVGVERLVDIEDISVLPIIQTRQGVEQMIELSLMTEDREWFDKLIKLMKSDHLVSN